MTELENTRADELDLETIWDGDEDDDEDWGTCAYCGEPNDEEHDFDCSRREFYWMKGILPEGDRPLDEVASAAEVFAAQLRKRANEGWVIDHHDNGHLMLGLPLT